MGKSRLAPIKQMTIPRLELSAAVLAVKVDGMLRRELRMDIHGSTFWTDRMIVLHYIRSTTRRFQMFVANRVATIHDGSSPDQWRHVDSASNPADDASRGLDADDIHTSKRWIEGPDFLSKDETEWPSLPVWITDLLENDKAVKREVTSYNTVESQDVFETLFS